MKTSVGVKPARPAPDPYRPVAVKRVPTAVTPFKIKTKPKPSRNDRRRERYLQDGDYQETLKARSRGSYRTKRGMELSNCLRSLAFYETLAATANVELPNKQLRSMQVMTLANVANCLQKIYQTIWRWKQKGMIPEPALTLEGRGTGVYSVQEVRVFIEEVGAHEKVFAYYRADHTAVTERIFDQIGAIRKQWR